MSEQEIELGDVVCVQDDQEMLPSYVGKELTVSQVYEDEEYYWDFAAKESPEDNGCRFKRDEVELVEKGSGG